MKLFTILCFVTLLLLNLRGAVRLELWQQYLLTSIQAALIVLLAVCYIRLYLRKT